MFDEASIQEQAKHRHGFAALALGAIGVVYGDIGTSPSYTVKEVFSPATGVPLDAHHLIGTASVIFCALMVVVTLKYVILILRAHNRGEGGIMVLTALAAQAAGTTARRRTVLLLLGVFGASLFYGDSVITPAISVLSAVEGIAVMTVDAQRREGWRRCAITRASETSCTSGSSIVERGVWAPALWHPAAGRLLPNRS